MGDGRMEQQRLTDSGDESKGNLDWMLPFDIFKFLKSTFDSGSKILEFGSGDGTALLAEYFEICSIEHDEEWAKKIATTCHLIPITSNEYSEQHSQVGWYDRKLVEAIIPDEIDIVIIDGPPGTIGRHGVLSILNSMPKSATYIVDDVHREQELDLYGRLLQWHGGIGTIYTAIYRSGLERKWATITPLERDEP
tara:strand:+ start:2271 stop:2852 length:582 start_codon:yes stop_codon:yes gene_type:complete